MGLGGFKSWWQRQTKDFAHEQPDKYTVLVFDNRGLGDSDKPFMRYSTSEMARDTIELMNHLGWTRTRQLHVVGISMGGMIAQEIGLAIPDRVCSLSLISTAAGLFNTVGFFENIRNRINLLYETQVFTPHVGRHYPIASHHHPPHHAVTDESLKDEVATRERSKSINKSMIRKAKTMPIKTDLHEEEMDEKDLALAGLSDEAVPSSLRGALSDEALPPRSLKDVFSPSKKPTSRDRTPDKKGDRTPDPLPTSTGHTPASDRTPTTEDEKALSPLAKHLPKSLQNLNLSSSTIKANLQNINLVNMQLSMPSLSKSGSLTADHNLVPSIPRAIDIQLANIKHNLYTEEWLRKPDECESESVVKAFPSNGDRMAASELRKRRDTTRFVRHGFMAQAIAAGWHRKSAAQLKEIGDRVGRERIMVVHGGQDRMIPYPHAPVMLEGLGGRDSLGAVHLIMDQGHVIPVELRKEFHGWVEEIIAKGEALNGNVLAAGGNEAAKQEQDEVTI